MTILGIDLGTTNSACAIWRDGKPVLIPNRLGSYLTPSVVGLDDGGEILVGESARHRLISHPAMTASVFKRYMGSDHRIRLGKRDFSAPELSSLILRSLKEDAESFLGEPVSEAVISVPAYFNDVQRKATKLAGELAGLQVDRLINEPTAAAVVYGLHERNEGSQFMIVDLGGGTFDVSVVEYFEGVLEVHASAGDNYLGGEEFLHAMAERFFADVGVKAESLKPTERQRVYEVLEGVKRKLSFEREITVAGIIEAQQEPWHLDRPGFEKMVQPLLYRAQVPIERALRDARLHPDEIGEIVLVGGATRMHAFRSLITRMFRRIPASNVDPDLVVAMGAGIQAGLKQKDSDLDDVVLTDVCPYTLGVEVVNEADPSGRLGGLFLPIIERNSVVPISVAKTLATVRDNQAELTVSIYQGESRLVKHNIYLGELEIKIPKAAAGKETIDVRYSYDMNGLLEVDVVVNSTGKTHRTTIINSPGSLSQDEIERTKEKLAKLKFHPREHEDNRTLLARAERLYESCLGEDREQLGNILTYFDQVLERQDPAEIARVAKQVKEVLDNFEGENLFS